MSEKGNQGKRYYFNAKKKTQIDRAVVYFSWSGKREKFRVVIEGYTDGIWPTVKARCEGAIGRPINKGRRPID